jgi:hypothetical protein
VFPQRIQAGFRLGNHIMQAAILYVPPQTLQEDTEDKSNNFLLSYAKMLTCQSSSVTNGMNG